NFVEAAKLGADDAKLSRVIDEAVYVAGLPRAALEQLGVRDQTQLAALTAERAAGPLVVKRMIEGIGKRIDVAQYLLSARVGEGAAVLARAGLIGELVPIEI